MGIQVHAVLSFGVDAECFFIQNILGKKLEKVVGKKW